MDTFNSIETKSKKKNALSEAELELVWAEFAKDKSNKILRDKIILQYIHLVRYAVNRIRANLPQSISTDDIAGYGVEGLLNAVERFDLEKGAKFETYALTRIRGTIIDKVRSQDWVPRGTRRKFKEIQKAIEILQAKLGRKPTNQELAEALDIPKEKIDKTITEMNSNSLVSIYDRKDSSSEGLEIIDTIQDSNSVDPLVELEEKDVKKELSSALSRLPERERMILALYYHENLTLKEIGAAIDISESRVCQLHAQAIMKLRNLLNDNKPRLRRSIV